MLEGGLVARRPYLIVGPSGTGKTTMALEFLCEGARRGERVLLVTLEEPPNEARVNHRGLEPVLDRVEVFDAIPDIMRYERTPFKDIASVRSAVPFSQISFKIRKSPELASVEVTITALEQMLRTEVLRKGYTRLVIDSLTALQYFCMKGFDPVAGAQSLLRFLSDLKVTTIITVEAPLEDVETPERMLARGEIRLFRWELDGQTVRAVGVEKFRGSSHDVRLHPYRIGPQGTTINLDMTISRDTRQIIEPIVRHPVAPKTTAAATPPPSSVTPLLDEVRDLILLGADVAPARSEIEAALTAAAEGRLDQVQAHLSRVSSLVIALIDTLGQGPKPTGPQDPGAAEALQRVLARVDSFRTGVPPTSLPPQPVLQVQLGALLSLLPVPAPVAAVEPAPGAAPVPEPASASAPVVVPTGEPPPSSVRLEPTPPAPPPVPSPEIPEVPASVPVAAPAPTLGGSSTPDVGSPPTPAPSPAAEVPALVPAPPPSRPKTALNLGAPPSPPAKLRPATGGPRVAKVAPVPAPTRPVKHEEPPPLPKGVMPQWLSPPPLPASPAAGLSPAAAPISSPPSVPAEARPSLAAIAPTSPAKKRRRSSGPPLGRKGTGASRELTPHEPPVPSLSESVVSGTVAPSHNIGAPTSLDTASSPKPRRRAPRKRKAPPVVAVEVEPVPPGALGTPEQEPSSEPRDPSAPTGG